MTVNPDDWVARTLKTVEAEQRSRDPEVVLTLPGSGRRTRRTKKSEGRSNHPAPASRAAAGAMSDPFADTTSPEPVPAEAAAEEAVMGDPFAMSAPADSGPTANAAPEAGEPDQAATSDQDVAEAETLFDPFAFPDPATADLSDEPAAHRDEPGDEHGDEHGDEAEQAFDPFAAMPAPTTQELSEPAVDAGEAGLANPFASAKDTTDHTFGHNPAPEPAAVPGVASDADTGSENATDPDDATGLIVEAPDIEAENVFENPFAAVPETTTSSETNTPASDTPDKAQENNPAENPVDDPADDPVEDLAAPDRDDDTDHAAVALPDPVNADIAARAQRLGDQFGLSADELLHYALTLAEATLPLRDRTTD